ncbi:MAG TPA: hypothetical protein PLI09_17900 [Candidatus Hydrogenedentes bacterium]|nr:hypothetical protein [Candidatus Hydrogenedentota bacterium]
MDVHRLVFALLRVKKVYTSEMGKGIFEGGKMSDSLKIIIVVVIFFLVIPPICGAVLGRGSYTLKPDEIHVNQNGAVKLFGILAARPTDAETGIQTVLLSPQIPYRWSAGRPSKEGFKLAVEISHGNSEKMFFLVDGVEGPHEKDDHGRDLAILPSEQLFNFEGEKGEAIIYAVKPSVTKQAEASRSLNIISNKLSIKISFETVFNRK